MTGRRRFDGVPGVCVCDEVPSWWSTARAPVAASDGFPARNDGSAANVVQVTSRTGGRSLSVPLFIRRGSQRCDARP